MWMTPGTHLTQETCYWAEDSGKYYIGHGYAQMSITIIIEQIAWLESANGLRKPLRDI